MTKHTHRGTCQVCGSAQAVNNKTGLVAKHGYTVDWGMFQGQCQGSHELPIEKNHDLTLQIIGSIEEILSGMKLIDLKGFGSNYDGSFKAARLNNIQFEAMTDHVIALRNSIEKRYGQDLYMAPRDEDVERIKERHEDIRDAYTRAEQLKKDGWTCRVTQGRLFQKSTLSATRKVAA